MEQTNKKLIIGKVGAGSKFKETIEELYFKVFIDYPWYDEIEPENSIVICKKYFEDNDYTVLAGATENKVIGFVVVKDILANQVPKSISKFNKYNLNGLYIEETGVDTEYQQQGFGKELIRYVMEKYPNRFLYFTTNNSPDSPMRKLTKSLGFEFVTEEDGSIKIFPYDDDKGSPTQRCSLFYNNIREKEINKLYDGER